MYTSLTESAAATFEECYKLLQKKGIDYDRKGEFTNFEFASSVIDVPVERVMLLLIGWKLSRLSSLLISSQEPTNESVEDTILDCVNYLVILKAYRDKSLG